MVVFFFNLGLVGFRYRGREASEADVPQLQFGQSGRVKEERVQHLIQLRRRHGQVVQFDAGQERRPLRRVPVGYKSLNLDYLKTSLNEVLT